MIFAPTNHRLSLMRGLAYFIPLALPVAACLAQDPARMDQVVQTYVANRGFMGTVLVARGAQVLFSKGYGSADLEWDVPNSPNTKFRLGSVTKQFTAASILLLEERGKLSVERSGQEVHPERTGGVGQDHDLPPPDAHVRHSELHQLSGLPKLEPFATTPEELVARFRDKPLDFQPGENWSYSNSGYVLLTYLIEKITGGTYEAFVRDNIFTPLGMKDSGYDSNSAIISHRAAGYVFEQQSFRRTPDSST